MFHLHGLSLRKRTYPVPFKYETYAERFCILLHIHTRTYFKAILLLLKLYIALELRIPTIEAM